jgi:4'-phosphopantetheinyl transferase
MHQRHAAEDVLKTSVTNPYVTRPSSRESLDGASKAVAIEWPKICLVPPLVAGDVHIWAWDYSGSSSRFPKYLEILSIDERERLNRYRFSADKLRFAVSRARLRTLIAGYLNCDSARIKFDRGPHGKPRLNAEISAARLMFNLSTTARMTIVAIALDDPLGVDLEEILPLDTDVERSLSVREQSDLLSISGESRLKAFYECWTRKEAILKAEGLGLTVPLDSFDVSVLPGHEPRLLESRPAANLTHGWKLSTLEPNRLFTGALATRFQPQELKCFQFVD